MRGCGVEKISTKRRAKWQEIATVVSHEFTAPRSSEQCRKKFQNVKGRSINKVSGLRHPPTGGGPSAVLSVAESCVADHLATHEVVTGIGGGFDSDDLEQIFRASKPASMIMADEPTSEATIPETSGGPLKSCRQKTGKAKRKIVTTEQSTINELTAENLSLDNVRIREETKKIKLQMDLLLEQKNALISVKEMADAAKSYYLQRSSIEFNSGNPFVDSFTFNK
ncbi:uncharacterized protein LOC128246354 isoform X1 [Mya arenaria]|uniref:uncharacterized protein LOC128246354 isoform X1 n=1 Tax=Mya arenaria TaxID=6604 RepID=UPI0022E0D002|nr:uncharacterized protein LOC128246354 isoform X1 [Mya arenaria]